MRIQFNSINYPKKAAKRLQKAFSMIANYTEDNFSTEMFNNIEAFKDYKPIEEISLSKAQAYTAEMLGYRDWHELEETIKLNKDISNKFDEDVDKETENQRTKYQWEILNNYYNNGYVNQIVFSSRVSSKNPLSDSLDVDLWFKNYFVFDAHENERDFYPSMRSGLNAETINNIQEKWSYHHDLGSKTIIKLTKFLDKEPENITAIWTYLCVLVNDDNLLKLNKEKLFEFENEVEGLIGNKDYLLNPTKISWHRIDNRDFLRTIVMIADAFYKLKNYVRANYWFQKTTLLTDYFNEGYKKEMLDAKKKIA